jgi:hypothetical protein
MRTNIDKGLLLNWFRNDLYYAKNKIYEVHDKTYMILSCLALANLLMLLCF